MRRHRFESCRSNCDFNSQREVLLSHTNVWLFVL
nr:MAG TPA: hypothetical protein [Caudoviricetes sp.]